MAEVLGLFEPKNKKVDHASHENVTPISFPFTKSDTPGVSSTDKTELATWSQNDTNPSYSKSFSPIILTPPAKEISDQKRLLSWMMEKKKSQNLEKLYPNMEQGKNKINAVEILKPIVSGKALFMIESI